MYNKLLAIRPAVARFDLIRRDGEDIHVQEHRGRGRLTGGIGELLSRWRRLAFGAPRTTSADATGPVSSQNRNVPPSGTSKPDAAKKPKPAKPAAERTSKRAPPGPTAALFANAEKVAKKIVFEPAVMDHLYEHSRYRESFSRADWEEEIRSATALDKALKPYIRRAKPGDVDALVNPKAVEAVARTMSAAPTLALCFHSGFPLLRRTLFTKIFDGAVVIASSGDHAATDGAYALFAAREALLQGRPVLMAPDGRYGKETGVITVLGAQRAVADGAPFLAHMTGCRTMWFAVERAGRGFTLGIADGPRAEKGERFPAFRERFYRFYADQLEAAFTGDPRNLPLIRNWSLTFSAMLEGKVDRTRRSSNQAQPRPPTGFSFTGLKGRPWSL